MKKIIAMLLAIVMVCALSVSAFAAYEDVQVMGAQDPIDINGAYVKTDRVDEYWIDITWTDMTFTYTEAKDEWNENTLEWDDPDTGTWGTKTTATITVTNRSSVAVDAEFDLNDFDTDDATLALDETELNLQSATNNTGVVTLTVSDKLTAAPADGKLGTITITLADPNANA